MAYNIQFLCQNSKSLTIYSFYLLFNCVYLLPKSKVATSGGSGAVVFERMISEIKVAQEPTNAMFVLMLLGISFDWTR